MNSVQVLKDYHMFYGYTNFRVFCQNCENCYCLAIKLNIVKEKVHLYLESRFEAFKVTCRKNNVPVLSGLKGAIHSSSLHSTRPVGITCISDYISHSNLTMWNKCWWEYAKVYSKTASNFVERDVATADLLMFLQILTSCSLLSDDLSYKALAVIKVRNCYAHVSKFQVAANRLNQLFCIIEDFENLLVHVLSGLKGAIRTRSLKSARPVGINFISDYISHSNLTTWNN